MNDPNVHLVAASAFSPAELTALLNRAYIDYYVPIRIDDAQFSRMCYEEDIDLDRSSVAVSGGQAVGIALLSVRQTRGWISGVGVVPSYRRCGIGQLVVRQVQAAAIAAGVKTLRLEVLAQNQPGASLYQRAGFTWERDLLVLTLDPDQLNWAPTPAEIEPGAPLALLSAYDDFHDLRAPWQRERASIQNRASQLHGLGYWQGHQLVGYLLYHTQNNHCTVYDLAVADLAQQRIPVAQALLHTLHMSYPGVGGLIINVPAQDPMLAAFKAMHYRIWQTQQELLWIAE